MSIATPALAKEPKLINQDVLDFPEPWTLFWDMHSGGDTKLPPYEMIYVPLDKTAAIQWFEHVTGRCPDNVTCPCCGEDYSVSSGTSLYNVAQWHLAEAARRKGQALTLETAQEYFDQPTVLVAQPMGWLPGINNLEA